MSIALFLMLAGFIIGLGAVTVIDTLGFLARTSPYWTETTIRAHKVTKPLIWIGMIVATVGGILLYWGMPFTGIPMWHASIAVILVINGSFLSLYISPFLLRREQEGRSTELLPRGLQRIIVGNFIVSFLGWWGAVVLLIVHLS